MLSRARYVAVLTSLALVFGAPLRAEAAPQCRVDSSSGIRFGSYNRSNRAPLDAVGYVAIECLNVSGNDSVEIALSRSRGGGFIPRKLTSAEDQVEYNLFLDAARTVVWGDGTSGTSTIRVRPPNGRTLSVPVFARVAAGQNVHPGDYEDVVIVTVFY